MELAEEFETGDFQVSGENGTMEQIGIQIIREGMDTLGLQNQLYQSWRGQVKGTRGGPAWCFDKFAFFFNY